MGQVLRFTDTDFEDQVLGSDVPVLVDFWASWCPACKMAETMVEQLAKECDGRVRIGKLHVDRNPKTASQYRIQGVPTFGLFCSGEMVQQRTGSQSRDQLRRMINGACPSSS